MDIHFFNELFESFNKCRILVIGDAMIDSYMSGKVERISPEAPVPVLDINTTEKRLGGAGNVALNLQSLGATAYLCSIVGDDANADEFSKLMQNASLDESLIFPIENRKTSIKHRLISGTQQLLRVDDEDRKAISKDQGKLILEAIQDFLEKQEIHAVILQDYNKGLLNKALNEGIIEACRSRQIPVAVDPKKENFLSFKHCTLFKPNLKELKEGLNQSFESPSLENLQAAAKILRDTLVCENVLITLSDKGIFGDEKGEAFLIPAKKRDISDVSGAGDTVIAVVVCAMAAGADFKLAARLSNLAGSLVCEKVGVVPVDKELLFQEAILSIK